MAVAMAVALALALAALAAMHRNKERKVQDFETFFTMGVENVFQKSNSEFTFYRMSLRSFCSIAWEVKNTTLPTVERGKTLN